MKNEAKEYLNQIRYINLDINSRQEELEQLKASFLGSQQLQHDKISSSKGNNQEDNFIRYVETSTMIDDRINELWDMKVKIGKEIDQLEDDRERFVLRERYVLNKSWKEISYSLDCSVRNTHLIHGAALETFRLKFLVPNECEMK